MRIASTLAVTFAAAAVLIACANETPPAGDVRPKINDGIVVDATEKTREETGVHYWGISNGSGPSKIKGYDEAGKEIVGFEYASKKEGDTTTLEAILDSGKNTASLKVASDGTNADVLEDTFQNRARPLAILARLVADLSTQAVMANAGGGVDTIGRDPGVSATSAPIAPLDTPTLGSGDPNLVSTCMPGIVPTGAQAGQTTLDCAKNPKSAGCAGGVSATGAKEQCCGNSAAVAESYLGRNASELKGSGDLPMDPSIPSDICCANFVSATLQQAGLIDWHTNGVADLASRLKAQGWTQVSAAQARPGDVAIINGSGHTELVQSNQGGKVTLIGSNNINADGSQQISTGNPYGNTIYLTPPASQCKK